MPRRSRIDAPEAIHHIIARGIERRKIFMDDEDRDNFLNRLATIITDTRTTCYAWALIPNHFHLLLRTGKIPISTVMRKLLTGYAVSFNRKHKRSGHLFQNRYKSILCQEDTYLLELVRYIHLNPLRAGLAKTYDDLGKYPHSGHSAIKGTVEREWQNTEYVLSLFADKRSTARKKYGLFVREGIARGKRTDLTGGGLIRSYGGWEEVARMRRNKDFQKSDERILGDGAFVAEALAKSGEPGVRKDASRMLDISQNRVAEIAANQFNISPDKIYEKTKRREIVKARNLFCFWLSKELGQSMTEISSLLGLSVSAISQGVEKGAKAADELGLSFQKELKL